MEVRYIAKPTIALRGACDWWKALSCGWRRGESLKAIGRAFGKESSSIYFLVAPHGGIRPAERRRSRLALTLAEREVNHRAETIADREPIWGIARPNSKSPGHGNALG